MRGENEAAIQGLAGHAQMSTTLRYTQIGAATEAAAVRRLSYAALERVEIAKESPKARLKSQNTKTA